MSPSTNGLYARWRRQPLAAPALREDTPPPERLLQAIWQHQRLHRDQLATLDGQTVRVLHPGFANAESGPDFRNAVIQIGDESPRTGDIEVDLRASGWHTHGHDRNPGFRNVILHVVWDAERTGSRPTLALRTVLDAPLSELRLWLDHEPAKLLPETFRGKCCSPLSQLTHEQTEALLREAALVRLEAKAAQLRTRARNAGWEQALWEGIFRALGYKHNVWPMHNLAESLSRWGRPQVDLLPLQARLLGVSGLLPTEPSRTQSGTGAYLRRVWDAWWRERDELTDLVLPRSVWRLHGLRPANHPHRRLALAAHWLHNGKLPARLEKWCAEEITNPRLVSSLERILTVQADEFWSWHWTLRSKKLARPQALLGSARVTDLAVNVILPWLWTRASERDTWRCEIERRFLAWPAAEDNAVLRLVRQRLLGGRRLPALRAAGQQGLLQIVRDYCDHSNAICDECRFPELVAEWQRQK